MRPPTKPEGLEIKESSETPVGREPSYPDRARIDSDVRAFLRPASSPWIVFDRDSRVDDWAKSALRLGAVFASSPNLRGDGSSTDVTTVTMTNADATIKTPMFPPSSPSPEPVVEPSNVVVATDVAPPDAPPAAFEVPEPIVRRGRSTALLVGACVAVLALVGGSVAVAKTRHHSAHAAAASHVVAPPAETPAIAPPTAPAPAPATEATPTETLELGDAPTKAPVESTKKGHLLGKLTIKGDPKIKNVWFDGKRMLGVGTRSFLVACGMHTVAVNDKLESKDIEIPCLGEFLVTK